jgi:hypothetical protein
MEAVEVDEAPHLVRFPGMTARLPIMGRDHSVYLP